VLLGISQEPMQPVELQLDVAALVNLVMNCAKTVLKDAWFAKSFTWPWPEKSSINLLKFNAIVAIVYIAYQFCAVAELNLKSHEKSKTA
jgi:hypothetical protein